LADNKIGDFMADLSKRAIKVVFDDYFKLEQLSPIIKCFQDGMVAKVSRYLASGDYMDGFDVIPGLKKAVQTLVNPDNPPEAASAIEFILEGLHLSNKLNREVVEGGLVYK
jgi:magnesium chelatase subunit I